MAEKERTCFRCGSKNVIKQVSTLAASMPEIRDEILAGKAEISHRSIQSGVFYKCRDCGFSWDTMVERQLEAEKNSKK